MNRRKLMIRLVAQTTLWFGLIGAILFWAAGTWRWPQAWSFIAIFVLGSIGFSLWLLPRDPALLASRLGPLTQRGQPVWDKVFLITFILGWMAWLGLMGLDARRWRTSDLPVWANVVGGFLTIGGFAATMVVFRANSFAAPVVRVQAEREQRVIDTGPYAWVRHPMYASALLYLVGTPCLLGSWYGLASVPLFIAGLAPRAVAEERHLKKELPGYSDYMKRVRYRLIPGVW